MDAQIYEVDDKDTITRDPLRMRMTLSSTIIKIS